MGPDKPLPYGGDFNDAESYVNSLLDFVGTNDLLRTLCGGVHILDFFTSDPDLYSIVLPQEWRDFFAEHDIMDLLDLFMREDLARFLEQGGKVDGWREGLASPRSLLDFLTEVRKHLLDRRHHLSQCAQNRSQKKLARHVSVGMTLKKVHEVGLFASYIDNLATEISSDTPHHISHLVDFGSGQNYLGRALASEPYNRDIIAIESKSHNAERAREFDVKARLVERQRLMRNKKAFRSGLPEPVPEFASPPTSEHGKKNWAIEGRGNVQYVEHRIQDGDLSDVVARILGFEQDSRGIMATSLHSCGNLVHHGLRSLLLNPSVKAVALVGCCYNLITERLGPATYKLPQLRPTTHAHPRLEKEGEACDPHGFPMSECFCSINEGKGVRLNITARMMAVQAPQNWGRKDSEGFFTRHFYRALLQRVFLDRGVVGPPSPECVGGSAAGHSSGGTPITIGSLRKGCYEDFVAYVRGASAKLYEDPVLGGLMREKMEGITDAEIAGYERRYAGRKKDLSVIWSLMAVSAGVVEAAIVVDRWLWLKEQREVVGNCWVESVFEYGVSPRNLVVVGVKR